MELSQEVYSIIVRHVGTRSDLNSLCRVSKRFRREAEKALYNTLHLRGQARSVSICNVLNHTPRLALLVEALSVFVEGGDSEEDDEDDDSDIDMGSESSYSDDFWKTVASALQQTAKLRFLSVYLERVGQSQHAWILDGCTFQLRTFHSDFDWDHHLETFLRSQTSLHDLYLADYMIPGCPASSRTPFYNTSPPLPSLSMLECTLSEAAVALVPGRPVERVKTCFSKTKVEDKRAELRALLLGLRRSKKPLRTLDLADDVYQSSFTLELVAAIDRILVGKHKLRYLGTLVFPVNPSERVEFYTGLMRLPHLQCVELEVTEWDPPPMTPAALRALTYELRIYCPKVDRVVYVYDFDRVTMKVVDGLCVLDNETAAESLWREV